MRQTHTYAIVEISAAAYAEIRAKLVEANYDHLLSSDGGREVLDMAGLAVASAGTPEISDREMMRGLATQEPPEAPPWIEQPLGTIVTLAKSIHDGSSRFDDPGRIVHAAHRALYQVRSYFAALKPAPEATTPKFQRVESTNVWAYAYTPNDQTLHVQFKSGGSYRYSPVTGEDLRQFVETPSKGGFIASLKARPGIAVVFVENWKAVLGLAARS